MSNFYMTSVILVGNKFNYNVPDVQKISNIKYKYITKNNNIPNTVQFICCFEYPDIINSKDIQTISEEKYMEFGKIKITFDKQQIKSDGIDGVVVTAKFPESEGVALFIIDKPNTPRETVKVLISENKTAILSKENTATTKKGLITIRITSDKWHKTLGSDEILIEAN